ncbi:MAG TPA: nucleoside monophosphate kinase [Candidatus Pacearchaeota archaeon]|nr:nucleoside monophosphate kinase [Candidatus Pacearchaeota archaeon]HOK94302.1 nucleoside monophosphate kinase [Candidatus Pacearchaeota archaeon]HPO75342.1 nucleoside monophosphate kinase [Candidatus Pacearchaeota archaeon]
MKKPLVIIFLGRPGSGKGTQARLLREKLGLDYIGSGDLLRERKKKKDFTGQKIAKTIDSGGLVPTPVIFKLWLDKFENLKMKKKLNGFIIDGSPRKILEAYLIDEALEWYEWNKNLKIFLIKISAKESLDRLTKRRQCEKCGRIIPFEGEFKKLKACDKCGGKLINRPDDNLQSIKKRLDEYKKETMKVIRYYKKEKRLIEIKGEQSINKVFEEMMKYIK